MNDLQTLVGFEEPPPISSFLNREQYLKLAHHLANGRNGKGCFLGSMGGPTFQDLSTVPLSNAIDSTCKSIFHYDPLAPAPFALAVYDRSETADVSTWAAIDLDWHGDEGPSPAVQLTASKLWRNAMEYWRAGRVDAFILELSGRGLHLWMITTKAQPITVWHIVVRDILSLTGRAPAGIDLFPSMGHRGSKGKALRLPGSVNVMRFNPRDGAPISKIIAAPGLRDLCEILAPLTSSKDKPVYIGRSQAPSQAKNRGEVERRLLEKHRIDRARCRHNNSRAMINEGFFKLPDNRLLELADVLFAQASPQPSTSLEDHRFESRDILRTWRLTIRNTLFSGEEQMVFEGLIDPKEIKAFHCIHNFHRLARIEGRPDFAISSEALGVAIGFSYKTALEVIQEFCRKGIIAPTLPAIPRKRCRHYRWQLPSRAVEEIAGHWHKGYQIPSTRQAANEPCRTALAK